MEAQRLLRHRLALPLDPQEDGRMCLFWLHLLQQRPN